MHQSRHLVSHDRSASIQRHSTSALYLDPLSSADPCTMAQAALGRLSGLANKARSTIEPSYRFAEKNITEQYKKTMQANKQYVVQDQAAADKLFKQWFFTKLSRYVQPVLRQPCSVYLHTKDWTGYRRSRSEATDLCLRHRACVNHAPSCISNF